MPSAGSMPSAVLNAPDTQRFTKSQNRTPRFGHFFQRAHLVSGRPTAFMMSNWATFAVTCVVAGRGGPPGWAPTAAQTAELPPPPPASSRRAAASVTLNTGGAPVKPTEITTYHMIYRPIYSQSRMAFGAFSQCCF